MLWMSVWMKHENNCSRSFLFFYKVLCEHQQRQEKVFCFCVRGFFGNYYTSIRDWRRDFSASSCYSAEPLHQLLNEARVPSQGWRLSADVRAFPGKWPFSSVQTEGFQREQRLGGLIKGRAGPEQTHTHLITAPHTPRPTRLGPLLNQLKGSAGVLIIPRAPCCVC